MRPVLCYTIEFLINRRSLSKPTECSTKLDFYNEVTPRPISNTLGALLDRNDAWDLSQGVSGHEMAIAATVLTEQELSFLSYFDYRFIRGVFKLHPEHFRERPVTDTDDSRYFVSKELADLLRSLQEKYQDYGDGHDCHLIDNLFN